VVYTPVYYCAICTGNGTSFQPKAFCLSSDVIRMKIEASFFAAMKL